MKAAISDYKTRLEEIDIYFNFMEKLDNDSPSLTYFTKGRKMTRKIDEQLTTILKANGFILLYNLVESTCRNCLSTIHEEIKSNKTDFSKLNNEIKGTWVQFRSTSFFKMNENALKDELKKMIEILLSSTTIELTEDNIKKQLSGNVDLKKIKQVSDKYGFSISKRFNGYGDGLQKVKDNRNYLAHGLKTFIICGGDYTMPEMMNIKKGTIRFLNSLLKIVEKYIDKKKYLIKDTTNIPQAS